MKPTRFATALGACWILASADASALNQSTHAVVNRAATQQSGLDNVLRNQLDLPNGLGQLFGEKSALDWIAEGGIREDDGIRFFRHFHDPLKPWASAGLEFFGQFQSSVHWMQRPTTCPDATWRDGKDWSWSSARCYFHRALTESKADDRDLAWAYAFRVVGQLMHLVVDVSVPEHTRNDPHPLGGLLGSYEYWVETQHGRVRSTQETTFIAKYLATPERPDARLVEQPTGDAEAPVPIARLIDADVYTGADPNVTLTSAIGIAEFANANFFSEDSGYRRFLAPTYPYPSAERLVPSTRSLSAGRGVRAYYKKGPGDGLAVDPVLAECAMDAAFRDDGIATPQYKCADAYVWEQTATFMLPRAVGYAAALLDYFFRGSLEARVTLAADSTGASATLQLTNRTPGEAMAGIFTMYAEDGSGSRRQISGAEWTLLLAPDESSGALTFTVPRDTALTSWLVVFRGQLGNEGGAGQEPVTVAARVGSPTYHLRLSYWAEDASQGRFQEDDQDLIFLRPEQYTGPGYYGWFTSVAKLDYRGLGVQNDPFTGVSRDHTLFHRDPANAPGDAAQLQVHGAACYSEIFTTYQRPYFYQRTDGPPITVSVLEFEEPRDLAELLTYRGTVLPAVRRALGIFTFSDPTGFPASLPINLDGARFIGLETDAPAAPEALGPPPYWRADTVCGASASILVPR